MNPRTSTPRSSSPISLSPSPSLPYRTSHSTAYIIAHHRFMIEENLSSLNKGVIGLYRLV